MLSTATRVATKLRRLGYTAASSQRLAPNFSSVADDTNAFADRCDLNLVYSPYPPVPEGPYPPLAEFVMQNWKSYNQESGFLGHQTAIRDSATGFSRTFDDYYDTTTKLAAVIHDDFHIEEDLCVALYSPNHVEYLPISLAVSL
jgi:hypothetical protein